MARFAAVADPVQRAVYTEYALASVQREIVKRVQRLRPVQGARMLDAGCRVRLRRRRHRVCPGRGRRRGCGTLPGLPLPRAASGAGVGLPGGPAARRPVTPDNICQFDIIVANDVLEHVAHPRLGVDALCRLLAPGGCLYIEVPNKLAVGQVLRDGHFGLPVLTLMPRPWAEPYAQMRTGLSSYNVGYWRPFEWYQHRAARHGVQLELLNPTQPLSALQDAIYRLQGAEALILEPPADLPQDVQRAWRRWGVRYLGTVGRMVERLLQLEAAGDIEAALPLMRRLVHHLHDEYWQLSGRQSQGIPPGLG